MFNISGWHIIIVVAVLAAIGELTSGMIRKVAWTLASVIVLVHTFRVWGSE